MKMVQKWMQTLVLLLFCQETLQLSSLTQKMDGDLVEITCAPESKSNIVTWFRVQDNAVMELIASFSTKDGQKKDLDTEVFSDEQINKNILKLKAFKKARDSGVYTCASINGNRLVFGGVTRLAGPASTTTTTTTTTPPMTTAIEVTSSTTAKRCKVGKVDPSASCDLIIWAPVSAGCGFLFLLLLITVCHCNRTRTKRCPHHYKRQPRMGAPGQQHPIANNRLF